tara:strand:- start:79 stop:186 length:108 start_codon:yes stop_codon:yes gene_type:complete
MRKYNNKTEENTANEVLIAMVIAFCVIIVMDYVTM